MRETHIILLLCFTAAAVLSDLKSGRIPNGIIAAGLMCAAAYQIYDKNAAGFLLCLGGAILPVLFFGIFFYFRMIGAGDVKLLCMAGSFFGPSGCFDCIVQAILWGGLISAGIMLYRGNLVRRVSYFTGYVSRCSGKDHWEPYLEKTGEDARFCFSVPILLGVIYVVRHTGGSI